MAGHISWQPWLLLLPTSLARVVEETKKAPVLIFELGVAHTPACSLWKWRRREFVWSDKYPWKARGIAGSEVLVQIRSGQRRALFQLPMYFLPWDQCDLKWLGLVEQGWIRGALLSATKKRLVAAGQLFHLRQAECPWSLQKEVRLDENIILNKMV